MECLHWEKNGKLTFETIRVSYGNTLIYEGYADDLVTSSNGLQLRLNFGVKRISSVVAFKLGEYILWKPKMPLHEGFRFVPMIWSRADFDKLWTALRYSPEADWNLVENAELNDLKLMWLMTCKENKYIDSIHELMKSVSDNILALSTDDKDLLKGLNRLIHENWSIPHILTYNQHWDIIVAFLHDGREEIVLTVDENKNSYVYLGTGLCVKTMTSC